jgi:HlyD family secretion protein
MSRHFKKIILAVVVIGIAGGAAGWVFKKETGADVVFKTSDLTHGPLLVNINATGTVEPEEVIDVGAQVAGQILSFGKDANGNLVDYGSPVEEGTVLARIDDSLYVADAAEAEAQVQSASANIKKAEADLVQMKAKLSQAEKDWERAQKLGPSEALAQASYDAYLSTYETAKANVNVAQGAILQAKAGLQQAEAAYQRAKRNLGYCTIASPVKGVIIDRRVNIGQTVVASLNAPSLFLIAKDLTRMQVWVAVNEADIGKIYPKQPVTFTVDAFPGEHFTGEVGKVRLNASMTQNVVTYTVEILTDNSNGRLLPYLTANVQFELKRLNDVLQVQNAALRWSPSAEQVDSKFRKEFEGAKPPKEKSGSPEAPDRKNASGSGKEDAPKLIWILEGKHVRPVKVHAGVTDGIMTEVQGEGLAEGMKVVTGVLPKETGQEEADASNPFAPKLFRGGGSRSGGGGAR